MCIRDRYQRRVHGDYFCVGKRFKYMNPQPSNRGTTVGLAKYKVIFLGDQGVGKTSIINRYISNTFDPRIHSTVGVDFISKTLTINDRNVKLHLWDTAGQERFHSLIPSYIRDSSIAVIVYDITNAVSFANVRKWCEEVRQHRESAVISIVGNKSDIEDKRVVSTEELIQRGRELDAVVIELSAKTGSNVSELFDTLVQRIPGVEVSHNFSMTSPNYANQSQVQYQSDRVEKPPVQLSSQKANEGTVPPKEKSSSCC
eukprot:TRINITY_DN9171_c0_g1_i1.p1 TRINITY_DN9171_c0_g1~~TRINITY_DN9171_c0_g1_i1.p1  ORF type:complete len:257 (-),score=56.26 TRINITY_DN9171_c0_g1_i1:152-922(-)